MPGMVSVRCDSMLVQVVTEVFLCISVRKALEERQIIDGVIQALRKPWYAW